MKNEKSKSIKIGAFYGRTSISDNTENNSVKKQEHFAKKLARKLSLSNNCEYRIEHPLIEKAGAGEFTTKPKYQELLNLIKNQKIKFLIAEELARLSRSTRDIYELIQLCSDHGVTVHIPGLDLDLNNPGTVLVYQMVATLADFEKKLIRQRLKERCR